MKIKGIGLLLAGMMLLAGCAVGNKYDYDASRANLAYSGARRVTVAAWEQRKYVLSGDKQPDFVGLQRGNMGVPFDVVTGSKQPLATEMTGSLILSLTGAGFTASPVTLTQKDTEGSAVYALLRNKPARAVLLRVDNWESDTFKNPTVYYDLTLNVYDGGGRKLAAKNVKGSQDLDGSFFNAPGKAKKAVPEAFRLKIEQLLNAPEIVAALK
jgi:hypothetical protein